MKKTKTPLTKLLPKNSHDVEGVQRLLELGYPALEPILPHLFQWLETNGSEVELALRPFFAKLGAPVRDLACDALLSPVKPALKHSLLRYVLPYWPREVVVTLPLERFLYDSDVLGLDIWALKLMMDMHIPTHDGLKGLDECRDFKLARLKEHQLVLESLKR